MRLVLLIFFFLPIYISAQDTVSATPKKDIFFIFDVYVKEKVNKIPISNCTVILLGNDGTLIVKTTDSTGKVSFDKNGEERYVNKETNYTFEVTKENRFLAKGKFSTVGDTVSKRYVEEVFVIYPQEIICTFSFPYLEFKKNQVN
jgi:hypothetical protein